MPRAQPESALLSPPTHPPPCSYQDYTAEQIPTAEAGGASVRVMAGEAMGATGPIKLRK